MAAAARHEFDCVVRWKLDRFGRSVLHLSQQFAALTSYGVRFIALTQAIDTDTSNPPVGSCLQSWPRAPNSNTSCLSKELAPARVLQRLGEGRSGALCVCSGAMRRAGYRKGSGRSGFDCGRCLPELLSGNRLQKIAWCRGRSKASFGRRVALRKTFSSRTRIPYHPNVLYDERLLSHLGVHRGFYKADVEFEHLRRPGV